MIAADATPRPRQRQRNASANTVEGMATPLSMQQPSFSGGGKLVIASDPSHSRARRPCHDGFVAWPSRPWFKTWPICEVCVHQENLVTDPSRMPVDGRSATVLQTPRRGRARGTQARGRGW